jgi:hypothetical protein
MGRIQIFIKLANVFFLARWHLDFVIAELLQVLDYTSHSELSKN